PDFFDSPKKYQEFFSVLPDRAVVGTYLAAGKIAEVALFRGIMTGQEPGCPPFSDSRLRTLQPPRRRWQMPMFRVSRRFRHSSDCGKERQQMHLRNIARWSVGASLLLLLGASAKAQVFTYNTTVTPPNAHSASGNSAVNLISTGGQDVSANCNGFTGT